MLDAVLSKHKPLIRITVKGVISLCLVLAAFALPQIAHLAGGSSAGARFLPMYAPVLVAGCLLGPVWGIGVGVLSPVFSFALTTLALGNAMPAAARLPYMVAELAVFGLVSGFFSRRIAKTPLLAFPAVLAAQLAGRFTAFLAFLIGGQSAGAAWTSIAAGLTGLYVQLALLPLLVIGLAALLRRDR